MRRFQPLKLYSVEICLYQICKFVTLEENIWQKRYLGFENDRFCFVFTLYFHLGLRICMFDKSKLLQNTILNRNLRFS